MQFDSDPDDLGKPRENVAGRGVNFSGQHRTQISSQGNNFEVLIEKKQTLNFKPNQFPTILGDYAEHNQPNK